MDLIGIRIFCVHLRERLVVGKMCGNCLVDRTVRFNSDLYGCNPDCVGTSPEEARRRLDAILGEKVMRFNPYTVDDETLLACVERATWQTLPALTQMVVFHFHDIRQVAWRYPYDAIFFHIGNDLTERYMPLNALTRASTYAATLKSIHVKMGNQVLTNHKMLEPMRGKDFFVSHALPTRNYLHRGRPAYRLHRLKWSDAHRVETIRAAMIDAKITMLQEVLAHPYCSDYLCCVRNLFDYTTPINAAIAAIRRFPEAHPPR